MNSSIHIDNKGKDILILGKGPTQGLGEHSLTAEKMYSINFTLTKKKFCLSLHYNDIIDIENFDSSLLKVDKKSYKDIGIYNIGYITIKKISDCKNIYSVNPLYLRIDHASGYIEEKGVNKYLIFDPMAFNKITFNGIGFYR